MGERLRVAWPNQSPSLALSTAPSTPYTSDLHGGLLHSCPLLSSSSSSSSSCLSSACPSAPSSSHWPYLSSSSSSSSFVTAQSSPIDPDVVFVLSNGDRLSAHSPVLAARCPALLPSCTKQGASDQPSDPQPSSSHSPAPSSDARRAASSSQSPTAVSRATSANGGGSDVEHDGSASAQSNDAGRAHMVASEASSGGVVREVVMGKHVSSAALALLLQFAYTGCLSPSPLSTSSLYPPSTDSVYASLHCDLLRLAVHCGLRQLQTLLLSAIPCPSPLTHTLTHSSLGNLSSAATDGQGRHVPRSPARCCNLQSWQCQSWHRSRRDDGSCSANQQQQKQQSWHPRNGVSTRELHRQHRQHHSQQQQHMQEWEREGPGVGERSSGCFMTGIVSRPVVWGEDLHTWDLSTLLTPALAHTR